MSLANIPQGMLILSVQMVNNRQVLRTRLLKIAVWVLLACVWMGLNSAHAAFTTNSWSFTGNTNNGPFNATATGDGLFTSTLLAPAGSTIVKTGGQSGSYLNLPAADYHGTLVLSILASKSLTFTTLKFYDDIANANAPTGINWQYQIGSGALTTLGSTTFANTYNRWMANSFDLSSIGPIAGGTAVTIQGTLVGGNGKYGIKFDTVSVIAQDYPQVPEPAHFALLTGVLLLGGRALRKVLSFKF